MHRILSPPPVRSGACAVLARRPLLHGLAASALLAFPGIAGRAAAVPPGLFARRATLVIAGPQGGRLDDLSALITPALTRSLPPGTVLQRTTLGAADGVTGANQFAARAAPDGATVLMVPGSAALAWLAGDTRSHFDAAFWVPVMAGIWPGVVAGCLPTGALVPGARVRVAAATPVGVDLPALLAIELLGVHVEPVFGLAEAETARAALQQGRVDLVFLHGQGVAQQLARLAQCGAGPLFSLGVPQASGEFDRDPMFPDLPALPELCARLRGSGPSGPLYAAWRSAAAAAELDFALVLPELTPAALVALWRRAGAESADSLDVRATAAAEGLRTLACPAATVSTRAVAANAEAMLALRQWLASRFDWHPA